MIKTLIHFVKFKKESLRNIDLEGLESNPSFAATVYFAVGSYFLCGRRPELKL